MDAKEKVSGGLSLVGSSVRQRRQWVDNHCADCIIIALSFLSFVLIFLQHVLLGLRFNQLSWDHSYPEDEGDSHILWLEFDGEEDGTPVNKLLKIYSKQVRKVMIGL